MTSASRHDITLSEAVKLTGLSHPKLRYAVRTGKLSSRKLPGRTGHHLLNLDEVRRYAELVGAE